MKQTKNLNSAERKLPADFFELVYTVVAAIPVGRVTTYGAIAKFLAITSSARTVGWALNASHTSQANIPAHRVVNRNGMLTGKMHFATPKTMQQLLKKEKVKVENDTIVNFKQLFWDPSVELTYN